MKYYLLLLCLHISISCFAQQKKALIIGIDTYELPAGETNENTTRKAFANLKGCKNDALAMRSVVMSRFGFDSTGIQTLFDRDATHDAILKAIDALLQSCKKGDIAFIYYAGHGSQVNNSLSKEADKRDESIVPSDTWRKGVADVTDKVLAKKFNSFIDKGIKLTVILDCCHSGSMARGMLTEQPVYRYIEASDYDTKDDSEPTPPELRPGDNFLIMSAAQSNELAQEQMDANNTPHGAFTVALLTALNQQPASVSAARLFSSLRAILKSNGKKQEPIIAGSVVRQNETLLGIDKAALSGETFQVNNIKGNRVEFDAGYAQQILQDNELLYTVKKEDGKVDSVVVKIDNVSGVSKSSGMIIKGDPSLLKPGLSFTLANWVAPQAPLLTIYIPPATFTYSDIQNYAAMNAALKSNASIKWTNQLDKVEPDISYFFIDKKLMANTGTNSLEEIKSFSTASLVKMAIDKTCFFNLPPDDKLVAQLKEAFSVVKNIALTEDASSANYILYGTINASGKPAYGLARAEISLRDSLDALPLMTDYITLAGNTPKHYAAVADSLLEYSMRLAKVRGWMQLPGPKGTGNFPYTLHLRDNQTDQPYDTSSAPLGREVTLYLEAEPNANMVAVASRYVYVFVIDKEARMQLLYPLSAEGNVENKFPVYDNGSIKKKVALLSYSIGLPVGTDSYYMIATAEPINNLTLFSQEGIRTVGARGLNDNPITGLLEMGNIPGVGSRGVSKLSADWTLKKMQVKTQH
jgi:hypothetical protein